MRFKRSVQIYIDSYSFFKAAQHCCLLGPAFVVLSCCPEFIELLSQQSLSRVSAESQQSLSRFSAVSADSQHIFSRVSAESQQILSRFLADSQSRFSAESQQILSRFQQSLSRVSVESQRSLSRIAAESQQTLSRFQIFRRFSAYIILIAALGTESLFSLVKIRYNS